MLLFLDGYAHYDTSRLAMKYTVRNDNAVVWSIVSEGRTGNCLKRVSLTNDFQAGYLGIAPFATRTGLWTPQPSGVCGFAIKVDDLSRVSNAGQGLPLGLLVVEETAMGSPIGAGAFHLRVVLQDNGTFTLYRRGVSSVDTILANSVEGLRNNAWAYVECKWLIDDTVGTFTIRVNMIPVLTYTGDTRVSDAANFGVWNSVRLFGVASTPSSPLLTMRLSDLYLADLTAPLAADVHDFLGDGIIRTIVPNGVGAASGWTPSSGPNWDTVNDRPMPDDDGTYVATTTPGTVDLYQFEDIPAGAVVKAAQLSLLARKEIDGSAVLAPVIQPAGSGSFVGPTQGVASLVYDRYLRQPYDLNPATGAPFTAAEINTGQFGVQKVI